MHVRVRVCTPMEHTQREIYIYIDLHLVIY